MIIIQQTLELMLHELHPQFPGIPESQVYEDLSSAIRTLTEALKLAEKAALGLFKDHNINNVLLTIRTLISSTHIHEKYAFVVNENSTYKNIFHLFICRMVELLSPYKTKCQVSRICSIMESCIGEIEAGIISYQKVKNIHLVIKTALEALGKFLLDCAKRSVHAHSVPLILEKDNSVEREQSPQNIYTHSNRVEFPSTNKNKTYTAKQIKELQQAKSDPSLNKNIVMLSKRFKTLKCLGVDYGDLKSAFYTSRFSSEEFYEDCLRRNDHNFRDILAYTRNFKEFLKRQEQKELMNNSRKNKIDRKAKSILFSTKRSPDIRNKTRSSIRADAKVTTNSRFQHQRSHFIPVEHEGIKEQEKSPPKPACLIKPAVISLGPKSNSNRYNVAIPQLKSRKLTFKRNLQIRGQEKSRNKGKNQKSREPCDRRGKFESELGRRQNLHPKNCNSFDLEGSFSPNRKTNYTGHFVTPHLSSQIKQQAAHTQKQLPFFLNIKVKSKN